MSLKGTINKLSIFTSIFFGWSSVANASCYSSNSLDSYVSIPPKLQQFIQEGLEKHGLTNDFSDVSAWRRAGVKNLYKYRDYGFSGNYKQYIGDLTTPTSNSYGLSYFSLTGKKDFVSQFTIGRKLDNKYRVKDVSKAIAEKFSYSNMIDYGNNSYTGHHTLKFGENFKSGDNYYEVYINIHGPAESEKLRATTVEIDFRVQTQSVNRYIKCIKAERLEKEQLERRGSKLKL